MNHPAGLVRAFGPFCYDPEQRLLFRAGAIVPLAPKAIDTLHVLLEQQGRVVEKRELMQLVWPDTVVEEVGLARNISLLRKALGDADDSSEYIETIPRRGYRFVAPVTVAVQAGAEAPSVAPPARARRRWIGFAGGVAALASVALVYWQFYHPSRFLPGGGTFASLAVVPFESLGTETDSAGIPQSLNELVVADLSKLDRLYVISPSTVRRHQRFGISMGLMGRLLGLDVLVEGSVWKADGLLRVTSRLVDVHTGKVVLSDSFEYSAADIDQAESSAARDIAMRVRAGLSLGRQR
ncbi:MAG: winged helix-turn-helix domain-containing protein [Bryobacteraceae bacterium]|jgi:DNA-binding winged helix-turn-helix (wHTH) protein/TolB-like protein